MGELRPTLLRKSSPGPYGHVPGPWVSHGLRDNGLGIFFPPFFSPLGSKLSAGAEDTPLIHCPHVPRSLTLARNSSLSMNPYLDKTHEGHHWPRSTSGLTSIACLGQKGVC